MNSDRHARVQRKTNETDIEIELSLDGTSIYEIETGVGFFDHMLHHIARHGVMDLKVKCKGDLHIDDHHSVEDVGIALGQALSEALGDKRSIKRVGNCIMPMDEALVLCAIDISGRGYLACSLNTATPKLGDYTSELTPEFFRAVAANSGLTIHIQQMAGNNTHHIIEATFKAFARALAEAVSLDPRVTDIPSTKGTL